MVKRSLHEALAHLPRVVVFAELARQGSFRGAAQALGLSPSTVTHHIQAIEDALGVRLIERTSRSMSLTSAGRAFLRDTEEVLTIWQNGAARARSFGESPTGTMAVTAPDVIAENIVVPAIARLRDRHPQVRVELNVSTATLDLVADNIDVAIRLGPLPDSDLGVRLLDRGQHCILGSAELAARFPAKEPADLLEAPWIQFSPHPKPLQLLGPNDQRYALESNPSVQTTSGASYIRLILEGAGFGIVPRVLVQRALATGKACVVLPEWSMGPANFYAVTPSPRTTDVKVRLFTDILLEVFAEASL